MGVCSVKDAISMNYCLNETFRQIKWHIFNRLDKIDCYILPKPKHTGVYFGGGVFLPFTALPP